MKSRETDKNMNKTRAKKKGKIICVKKPNKKERKDNKMLSQKSEKGWNFFLTKRQLKKTEPKITVLVHELLFSLSPI
jgi:hypothetical protein